MPAFESAVRTHVGHKRKLNEDAVLHAPGADLWAVADGMGGHDAGELASAMVVERLGGISGVQGLQSLLDAVIGSLLAVNAELVSLAGTAYKQRVIGSTVVGLLLAENRYACFWAGDSRAYLVRGGGIEQVTTDHSLVQSLIDAGMLEEKDAESHPNANVVTRAVGADEALHVDTVVGDCRPGDVFLLASDGLTRLVKQDQLLAVLSANGVDAAADRLLEQALEAGAPDNVSLIIVRIA